MKIAVTDANIFIDIIYLQIHPALFKVGLEIYTTQLVLDELEEEQVAALQTLIDEKILLVYQFTDDEMDDLSTHIIKRSLSAADHSVIFVAEKLKAMVISGDTVVRKTCQAMNFEVHGILWLLDECIHHNQLTYQQAHSKLTDLMAFNKWLPIKECEAMLNGWAKYF